MNPAGPLKLVSGVRDLQIIDADGHNCGIVDDIEFDGVPGGPLRIEAILVGPGAYRGRLSPWALWLVRRLAGNRVVRVPWSEVKSITSAVRLRSSARDLGLMRSEEAARRYIPRVGAI
jgi:sporulation protein YlmC with PRC-barrel domain